MNTGVPTSGDASLARPADFFISYAAPDEQWALWVAATLEAQGRTTAVLAWDLVVGGNRVAWVTHQMETAVRTIAICSPAYFDHHWSTQEWSGALVGRTLTPLRVADCRLPAVLKTIAYRDLHGVPEAVARRRLLEAVDLLRPARVSDGFPGLSATSPTGTGAGSLGVPFPGQTFPDDEASPVSSAKPPEPVPETVPEPASSVEAGESVESVGRAAPAEPARTPEPGFETGPARNTAHSAKERRVKSATGPRGPGDRPGRVGSPTRRGVLLAAVPITAGAAIGAVVLTTRHGGAGQTHTPHVQIWQGPVRGSRTLTPPLRGHSETVNSVAFSPDGATLASGSDDHTVRLWDVRQPTIAQTLGRPLTGHSAAVTSVVYAAHRPVMASGGADGAAVLWNVTDPATPGHLGELTDPKNPLHALALSADGTILATGGQDLLVRLWDVSAPSAPRLLGQPLTGHNDVVRTLAFSPDGKILASGGDDRTVRLWDLADRAKPQAFETGRITHQDAVWTVAFAPHELVLASGGDDRTLRLWNLADPTAPQEVGSPVTGYARNRISALAFSPAGTTLAEGNNDHMVRLWDVSHLAAPRLIGTPLSGHQDSVWSVAFSPDGRILASASGDATIGLWGLE